jgi:hypothetical protein
MTQPQPLIRWPQPFVEYAGFTASFLASGAIGFRYAVLGRGRTVAAGALAAEMVNAFSPLALASAAVLAVFGAITAWTHLKVLAALWTTA